MRNLHDESIAMEKIRPNLKLDQRVINYSRSDVDYFRSEKYHHSESIEMAKTHYNFKFEGHTDNFVNNLDDFRNKKLYCDATIACDGKEYKVHQVVLSACSDFFANIFATTSCQDPVVVLQDVSRNHLENLLTYIYRGEVQVPKYDLADFVKVAKSLFIKGLMVPNLEKYQCVEHINGTMHGLYYSSKEDMVRMRAENSRTEFRNHIPPMPPLHHGYDMPRPPSYQAHMQMNGSRSDGHPLKRKQHMTEQEQYQRHEERHHKRPHYMVDHPQDLRITELPHQRCNDNDKDNSGNSQSGSEETPLRCAKTNDRKRSSSSETTDYHDDRSSILSNHNSHGTFQKLIAADEQFIKEEPVDLDSECDIKPPCPLDKIEDPHDDDSEEPPLQISEDHNDMPDIPSDHHSERSNPSSPEYSLDLERMSRSEVPLSHLSPTSHLRRELLRPVPHNIGLHHHQQAPPQSIPHPVIAPRDHKPQPQTQPPSSREPPPLMKIPSPLPTVLSDSECNRPPRRIVKDTPVSRTNTHLLVSAPPTYHSHASATNHLCFEIHNQQLGQVIVSGGTHIPLTPPSMSQVSHQPLNDNSINNYNSNRIDNDIPLNLSGGQRNSPEIHEDNGNDDPFLGKILTNRKKRLRGPKSWEFLVRLLKDPTTNPTLIRWENELTGVFRLVQPSIIAQRWGKRTGKHANECLTYENFARGLRYHYATGALKPVSEKSFVYRFGPKALKLLEDCDSSSFPYI